MDAIKDTYRIASEILRKFSNKETHECNIATQKAEFMTDEDFVYDAPETPIFLERNGLAEILSEDFGFISQDYWDYKRFNLPSLRYKPKYGEKRELSYRNSLSMHQMSVPGFYAVSFKIKALNTWYEEQTNAILGDVQGVVEKIPKGWGWIDGISGVYQFGTLGKFTRGRGAIGKIFTEAMNLFNETPQAISIRTLSQRTGIKPDYLRRRLNEINKQLEIIGLHFVGSGKGFYRIQRLDSQSMDF